MARQTHDQQTDSFFSALPEDIMILLTDLLSTQDFVHLIMSCKYYYHDLLGAVSPSVKNLFFLTLFKE
jgi:hypothetical protein